MKFPKFFANDKGATSIEYAFMASMIALVLLFVVGSVGNSSSNKFDEVGIQLAGGGSMSTLSGNPNPYPGSGGNDGRTSKPLP